MNKFRIVTRDKNGAFTTVEFTFSSVSTEIARERFTVAMERFGYRQIGVNKNAAQREELQGAPKFDGLLGAMWDGDALRYEDQNAYNTLSA